MNWSYKISAGLLASLVLLSPALAQSDKAKEAFEYAKLIASNPDLAESDSVWIMEYDSPNGGHVIQAFEGPKPYSRSKAEKRQATGKSGGMYTPEASDFANAGDFVSLPPNGTVTWSGTVIQGDGSNWNVDVEWTYKTSGPSAGSWDITSFNSSEIPSDPGDDEGPPTVPE